MTSIYYQYYPINNVFNIALYQYTKIEKGCDHEDHILFSTIL